MLCTMVFLQDKNKNEGKKTVKKGKKSKDDEKEAEEEDSKRVTILAKPMNQKLPWLQLDRRDAEVV